MAVDILMSLAAEAVVVEVVVVCCFPTQMVQDLLFDLSSYIYADEMDDKN